MSTPGNGKKRYRKEYKGSDPQWGNPPWVAPLWVLEDQQEDTPSDGLDPFPDKIITDRWITYSRNFVYRGDRVFPEKRSLIYFVEKAPMSPLSFLTVGVGFTRCLNRRRR